MFEIVMLIGFLAAGLAHLLPEEPKEKQSARHRQSTAAAATKRRHTSKQQSVRKKILILNPALAIFKFFQP